MRKVHALPVFSAPAVHHLWFLWFLCWLIPGFACLSKLLRWAATTTPRWLVSSPGCFLWLLPVTAIPQAYMGLAIPSFGPDTSAGILPMPHVLLYYAVFFGFGAILFHSPPSGRPVGRRWWFTLPFGLAIVFPLAAEAVFGFLGLRDTLIPEGLRRPVAALLQAAYTWLLCFALIGLFEKLFRRESALIRYLSDSSYWLYIAHLPLVIALQWWVRDWEVPSLPKFLFVCGVATSLLLLSYQFAIRKTWVGRLLNGRRPRTLPDAG